MTLKELREAFRKALLDARAIADEAATANNGDGRELTADEYTKAKAHLDEAKRLKGLIEAKADAQTVLDMISGIDGVGLGDPDGRPRPKAFGDRPTRQTTGAAFVDSPEWKGFLGSFPNGTLPVDRKGALRVSSPPVGFKTLLTGTSDTSGGAFVVTDRQPDVEMLGRRPFVVRNLVANRQTGSDTVEFVQQTSRVNAATEVPEATSTSDNAAIKPEGGFAFQVVQATVKTIAEWVPATRRALSDAAQLRGMIDQELLDDLEEELEDQIINGTGSGEQFTGILNTSGIQAQAYDTDLYTTTRKARSKIRINGRAIPTAYAMNPADWETFDLLRDANDRFYAGGPFGPNVATLWGLPVVESEAIPAGTAIVGAWNKAVLWDREQAAILVSDSHSDFFVRNLIAILAEMRAAFGILRPSAFATIDLTP